MTLAMYWYWITNIHSILADQLFVEDECMVLPVLEEMQWNNWNWYLFQLPLISPNKKHLSGCNSNQHIFSVTPEISLPQLFITISQSQVVRNTVRSFGEINLTMFEKYNKRRSDPVTVKDRVQELGILVVGFCDDNGEKCFWFCPRFFLSST